MATFLLCHRHDPEQCSVAFAAWKGSDSPLRDQTTLCSCTSGSHRLWFVVEAEDEAAALAQLPNYLARRTEAIRVREVPIP